MKNKGIAILAAVFAAGAMFACGIFTANRVFAAEDGISMGGGTIGTRLDALADGELMKAYKSEKYGDVGCTVVLPDGYLPSDSVKGMFVSQRNPLDSSNIYYTVSEGDMISKELTEEIYEETVENAFLDEGWDVDLQVETFEEIDMEGIPGYKIRSSYQLDDSEIEQLAYLILAEETYTITYSQMADDELMADFDISGDEIRLIRNEESSMARR